MKNIIAIIIIGLTIALPVGAWQVIGISQGGLELSIKPAKDEIPIGDGAGAYELKTIQVAQNNNWKFSPLTDAITPTSTVGIFVTASSTIIGNFRVDGNATTTGSLFVGGTVSTTQLFVQGNAHFGGNLDIDGTLLVSSTLAGNLDMGGFNLFDSTRIFVNINDGLIVTGNASTSGYLVVGTVNPVTNHSAGDLLIGNNATITTNLVVQGTSDLRGNVFDSGGFLTLDDDVVITDTNGLIVGHTSQIDFGATPEFQVLGTGTSDSSMGFARFENNAAGPDVRFLKSRGATIGANTIVQDGDFLGRFRFQGADGGDFNTTGAQVHAEVDGAPGLNDLPTRLVFSTTLDGASSVTERMTILNSGNVGIGTASPATTLDVNGATTINGKLDITGLASHEINGNLLFDRTDEASIIGTKNNFDFVVRVNDTVHTTFQTGGNVGIGTPTPTSTFQIAPNATLHLPMTGVTEGLYWSGSRLGVGTINPSAVVEFINSSEISTAVLQLVDADIGGGIQTIVTFLTSSSAIGDVTAGTIDITGNDIVFDATDNLYLTTTAFGSFKGLSIDNGTKTFGMGIAQGLGKLHIDQDSTSFAKPVLLLDQADINDTFINFIGTSAADGSRSISSDTTEDGAKFGAFRIEINGVTKWIRIYDDES